MRRIGLLLATTLFWSVLGIGPAGAATVPITLYNFTPNGPRATISDTTWLAQPFSTGPTAVSLNQLGVWVNNGAGTRCRSR